jgi:cellulose synthase/poly-beta-1,6-N-acetylglucosamine synthase-like glycosyltransferase
MKSDWRDRNKDDLSFLTGTRERHPHFHWAEEASYQSKTQLSFFFLPLKSPYFFSIPEKIVFLFHSYLKSSICNFEPLFPLLYSIAWFLTVILSCIFKFSSTCVFLSLCNKLKFSLNVGSLPSCSQTPIILFKQVILVSDLYSSWLFLE